jgi:hypothetical protein
MEKSLKFADFELQNHLRNLGCPVSQSLWPSIQVLCTDIMTRIQWLKLWDTLVTYSEYPELFYLTPVAELLLRRSEILAIHDSESLLTWLDNFNIIDINQTIKKAATLMGKIQQLVSDTIKIDNDTPLLNFRQVLPLNKPGYQPYTFIPNNML